MELVEGLKDAMVLEILLIRTYDVWYFTCVSDVSKNNRIQTTILIFLVIDLSL